MLSLRQRACAARLVPPRWKWDSQPYNATTTLHDARQAELKGAVSAAGSPGGSAAYSNEGERSSAGAVAWRRRDDRIGTTWSVFRGQAAPIITTMLKHS